MRHHFILDRPEGYELRHHWVLYCEHCGYVSETGNDTDAQRALRNTAKPLECSGSEPNSGPFGLRLKLDPTLKPDEWYISKA